MFSLISLRDFSLVALLLLSLCSVDSRAELEINAKAWVLIDADTSSIVLAHNESLALPPASITKLMTNYVLFTRLKSGELGMGDLVPISATAWKAEGSRMFAEVGSRLELGELLRSSIVQSGNDASIALAEYTGGSEAAFALLMNQSAAKLGLKHSNFVNSSGLPAEGHSMSALDIAMLSKAIIDEFPEFYTWYAEKEHTHNNIRQFNRNKLLWQDASVDGLKTGYTEAAGYCLVGSAKRKDQRWIAVVMGAESETQRSKDVMSLLNYGFNNYEVAKPVVAKAQLASIQVYGGIEDSLALEALSQGSVLVKRGQSEKLVTELVHAPYVQAPIKQGQVLGSLKVRLQDEVLEELPLVAMQAVNTGSWWKRFKDSIKLRMRELLSD